MSKKVYSEEFRKAAVVTLPMNGGLTHRTCSPVSGIFCGCPRPFIRPCSTASAPRLFAPLDPSGPLGLSYLLAQDLGARSDIQ